MKNNIGANGGSSGNAPSGGASDDNVRGECGTMAHQEVCAATVCERETTCERENACERDCERQTRKNACEREAAPFKTEVNPFGSTNDASLPPGVATDFLLARMMRSPAPPPQQRHRVEALENRTRIAPVDVEPAGTLNDAPVVAAPLMFETSSLTTGQMSFSCVAR